MKRPFSSFISFTRSERTGLWALCSLLVLLIAIKFAIQLWVKPQINAAEEQQLIAQWEVFKRSQPKRQPPQNDTAGINKDAFQDENSEGTPLPDQNDLNQMDSAQLVQLKGIGPVLAGKIVKYRNEHGPFTDVDQLNEVHRFPKGVFEVLKRHLFVNHTPPPTVH